MAYDYAVEKFILHGYKEHKRRTVEKGVLLAGIRFTIATILIWAGYNFYVLFAEHHFDHRVLLLAVNLSIGVLAPILAILVIRSNKKVIANNSAKLEPKKHNAIVAAASVGVVASFVFTRGFLSNTTSNAMIILSICVTVVVLVFFLAALIYYYKFYLIQKFCHNLKIRRQLLTNVRVGAR